MCGSLFAGTQESPGEYIYKDGARLKRYRGMASIDALSDGSQHQRCFGGEVKVQVATGVSGAVQDRGSLKQYVPYLAQGIKHGFQDLGWRSVSLAHEALRDGRLRFEIRSPAAQKEGGVHGLHSFERKLFTQG